MRRASAIFSQNSRSDSTESDVVLMKEFNQDIVSEKVDDHYLVKVSSGDT